MDRAHLVPKQRIKREHPGLSASDLHLLVWDSRCWVWACRFHHAQFDNYRFRIPRCAVPRETEEYAAEHGLVWSLMRDYK